MASPVVSVIVPTFNSADNLRRFLNSFTLSTYTDFEIIVNDDKRTNDVTDSVVTEAQSQGLTVHLIKENRMMAQARKAGVSHARGKYLFHLDSDMEISPTLLQECVDKMSNYDALVVPEESFGTTFWAQCKWLEKKCFQGVEQLESLRFITRDIYEKLGGHDERMVFSEDKDFDLRVREAGYSVGRTVANLRHNEGNLLLRKTLKKKLGYSKTANVFANVHPDHFSWQANPVHRYIIFARNIKYLFSHPFLYVGMIWMKSCEYITVAFSMLFHRL